MRKIMVNISWHDLDSVGTDTLKHDQYIDQLDGKMQKRHNAIA